MKTNTTAEAGPRFYCSDGLGQRWIHDRNDNGRIAAMCTRAASADQITAALNGHDEAQAEITRLKASNKELVEALEEIAQYDKDSKHGPGICPYGCDCPHIARAAIERARG